MQSCQKKFKNFIILIPLKMEILMIAKLTFSDLISQHIDKSMELALSAERYPLWKRACPELADIDFIRLGLQRCITAVDSGRHFLQITDDIHNEQVPLTTYFNALASARRMDMLKVVEQHSYQLHCQMLEEQGIDYLRPYPELNEYSIEAADGHFIDHACHTPKNKKGKVYAAGFIYAFNLRNGLIRPLCPVTNGTQKHQEIPILRKHLEKENGKKHPQQKNLYIYDKAVTDFAWWDQQKINHNYMISVLKENSVAIHVETISFDKKDALNIGVEAYDVYKNSKGVCFIVVTYRDPENGKCHRFITTLPKSIRPGIIAMLYYKRWTIEKAFNNSKSDFKERKAWSSKECSLENQMRLTAMSYNLMRVLEETSKQESPELIHPSDKKYNETLLKRQQAAQKQEKFVNPVFFQPRITRICSSTIRAVQSAIVTGKLLVDVMRSLIKRLIPRCGVIGEH